APPKGAPREAVSTRNRPVSLADGESEAPDAGFVFAQAEPVKTPQQGASDKKANDAKANDTKANDKKTAEAKTVPAKTDDGKTGSGTKQPEKVKESPPLGGKSSAAEPFK